uniref:Uncharacterized protein n=1 Tax=Oryza brachyantha TaxID=4533 RepID=J3MWM2_ORYBR
MDQVRTGEEEATERRRRRPARPVMPNAIPGHRKPDRKRPGRRRSAGRRGAAAGNDPRRSPDDTRDGAPSTSTTASRTAAC